MKETALEQYTMQEHLNGQNEQEILQNFCRYASMCRDPTNVYKYMEEKSICTFLTNYWTSRAMVFAEKGDFKDSLLCLKVATSMENIVNDVNIDEYLEKIKKKIVVAMKRSPPKGKRSANEYSLMYDNDTKVDLKSLQTLIQIFENNYKSAKKEIQNQFQMKNHGKPNSWLAKIQEQNEQKLKQIMKTSTSNHETFMSLRTPISKKDPMRLTKTMDSVEMLKKKKSTQPKQKRRKFGENVNEQNCSIEKGIRNIEDEENQQNDDNQSICVNTTPVGKQFYALTRKVTFNTLKQTNNQKGLYDQIQKIRCENIDIELKDSNSQKSHQNHRQKQKSISRRGSILKKKVQHVQMQQEMKN